MKTERFPPTHEIDIQGQLKKCPHDIQRYVKMLEANLNKAEDNCRKVVHQALEEAAENTEFRKIKNPTKGWSEGCNWGLKESKEVILSLKEKY